jgi:hypothetical protein
MIPDDKLDVIREFLRVKFPGADYADEYDFDSIAWTFRLNRGGTTQLITFRRDFLDDRSRVAISAFLETHLSSLIETPTNVRIIVSNKGIEREAY